MQMTKKSQIWVSAVLYVLIGVVVLVIVLEAGLPVLNSLQERNAFARIKNTVVALDRHIEDIASEGQGSQRVLPLDVIDGEVRFENNKLRWKLETKSKVVEPRTRFEQGNVVIAADVDVSASETSGFHILENRYLLANFTRFGSESNWTDINTSSLLNYIKFKDNNVKTNGTFSFLINESSSSSSGNGFTKLETIGEGLTSGILRAHINSTSFEYDIVFTLESKSDFLKVSIENFITR
jgi:hypothetical protein